MKVVKNTDSHDIEMPFEGTTYVFPQGKAVEVPDDVKSFLEERLPLSFNFGVTTLKKEKAEPVETYKTKVYTPESVYNSEIDMKVVKAKPTDTFQPDDAPASGTAEVDGTEWYGEGIQLDTLN